MKIFIKDFIESLFAQALNKSRIIIKIIWRYFVETW